MRHSASMSKQSTAPVHLRVQDLDIVLFADVLPTNDDKFSALYRRYA